MKQTQRTRLSSEAILASLLAVADPEAEMPLELLRYKRRRLHRLRPEWLLEQMIGLLTWCRDGVVQLARLPAGATDWARVCPAADRLLFELPLFGDHPPPSGSPASLCLLHLGPQLVAVAAEVRRRCEDSIIAQVAALDDPRAHERLLRPFLGALHKKGLWRTAEQRADLANRVLERLTKYLMVEPPRRPADAATWITRSPVRRMLPRQPRPEWDAALGRAFLDDLTQARATYLPTLRLSPIWAVWHVTNAEQARIRRAWRREQRPAFAVPDPEETLEEARAAYVRQPRP
jgi:hypothetical protein